MADFVPSASYESLNTQIDSDRSDGVNVMSKNEQRYVCSFFLFKETYYKFKFFHDWNTNGKE